MNRALKAVLCCMLIWMVVFVPVETVSATHEMTTEESTASDGKEEKTETVKLNLWVSAAKAKSVTLRWNKPGQVDYYEVLRSTKKKSGYKKIRTVKATKNQYTNAKLSEKKTYYYKVKAVLKDGGSVTSNVKTKVKVRGNYKRGSVYGPSLSQSQLNKTKDIVANFVNVYTEPELDDFYKVFYAHNYLCNTVSYEEGGWHRNYANTAFGALKYKKAQCSGYARAFKALCDGMGIGCRYVHANGKAANPYHQWNLVKVDKKWYLIDVQCNDSSQAYITFLIGSQTKKKGFYKKAYQYNTKGMPKLSKKDYDFSKYFE